MSKLIRACIAVAAFAAFAVLPATASAVNDPSVVSTASGSKVTLAPTHAAPIPIEAKNVGNTVMTPSFGPEIVCQTAVIKGSLETNTIPKGGGAGAIEGTITSASFSGHGPNGECSGAGGTTVTTNVGNGVPWCLRADSTMKTHEFQIRGGSCTAAQRSITFVLDTTELGQCAYESQNPISGTYTTHPNVTLSLNTPTFTRHGGFFCPSSGQLHMTFALQNSISIEDQ